MDSANSYTNAWNKSLSESSNHYHVSSLIKHKGGTGSEVSQLWNRQGK